MFASRDRATTAELPVARDNTVAPAQNRSGRHCEANMIAGVMLWRAT